MTKKLLTALRTLPMQFVDDETRVLEIEDIVVAVNPRLEPIAFRTLGADAGRWTFFNGVQHLTSRPKLAPGTVL